MSPDPTATSRRLPALVGVLLAANLAASVFVVVGLASLRERVDDKLAGFAALEREIFLYRVERTSNYEGLGFNALFEHLIHWATELQVASPSTIDFLKIRERLEDIVATTAIVLAFADAR